MALLQTLHLPHLPPALAVHVALYQDVKNAAFLQQQLLQGNPEFEYALIDASVILSSSHILAAVFRAVNDKENERLKSRNVHSETVFCLSPNNNIATSFSTFGIIPTTTSLIVIKISTNPSITASSISQHLSSSIEGTSIDFNDENIARFTDSSKVKKIYKLNERTHIGQGSKKRRGQVKEIEREGGGEQKGKEELEVRKEMEVIVLGMMALRGQT